MGYKIHQFASYLDANRQRDYFTSPAGLCFEVDFYFLKSVKCKTVIACVKS